MAFIKNPFTGLPGRRLITIGQSASVLPLADVACGTAPHLVRKIGQKYRADDSPDADLDCIGLALVHRDNFNADETEVAEDRRHVGLVARNAVQRFVAELVALSPDVIVATTTPTLTILERATKTVPIVFVSIVDPVGSRLVATMSRPGGNATGFVAFEYALATKWLELLKEIAPRVIRATVLRDSSATGIGSFAAVQAVGSIISGDVRSSVAIRGKADIAVASAEV